MPSWRLSSRHKAFRDVMWSNGTFPSGVPAALRRATLQRAILDGCSVAELGVAEFATLLVILVMDSFK